MNTTDNTTTGWIKIDRRILEWEWWDDRNTRDLFIYCLLRANHADKQWHGITIERGTFITSIESLAEGAGLTTRQTRTALEHLQLTGELTSETTNKWRVITICNYDKYQASDDIDRQAERQAVSQDDDRQTTSNRQTNDKQPTTNKNDKNEKNDKKVNIDDDADYARDAHEIIKNNFEDLESENGEADAATPQQAPTPQPPAPGDSHGDRYRPIGDLYQELRPTYYAESEATNALRMKINREQHRLLTTQEVGQYFDQYQETLVAGGCTIETMKDYRLHFRNWLIKQLQPKPQTQNNRPNGNNQTERPRQIADASQFVERL